MVDFMEWYKTLDIDKRIALKEMCAIICGVDFASLIKLLSFKKTINVIYDKLKMEGFDI